MEKYRTKKKLFCYLAGLLFLLFLACLIAFFWKREEKENFDIIPAGKTIFVKNGNTTQRLDLEEFLPCVVSELFSIDDEEEILKMQMVITRTYLLKKMGENVSANAKDLGIKYHSYQELEKIYGTEYLAKYKKWKALVKETNLKVIRYKDELIEPYFHIASIGVTRDGNEVLGSGHEYLQSVESKEDLAYKDYMSIQYITMKQFVDTLREKNHKYKIDVNNFFDQFSIKEKCSAGYVKSVAIGKETMGSETFCHLFGIPSQYFRVEKYQTGKEPTLRMIAKGKGNGLGVSLFGAKEMAKQGKKYQEILEYYYKNVVIG